MKTKDMLFYFGGALVTAFAAKSAYVYYQAEQESKKKTKAKAEEGSQDLMTYSLGLIAKFASGDLELKTIDRKITKAITEFSGTIVDLNAEGLQILLMTNNLNDSIAALLARELLAEQEAERQMQMQMEQERADLSAEKSRLDVKVTKLLSFGM